MLGKRATVDEAVLAELRAIRSEVQHLAERIGNSVARSELNDYVKRETFDALREEHDKAIASWHAWLPIIISSASLLFTLWHGLGLK